MKVFSLCTKMGLGLSLVVGLGLQQAAQATGSNCSSKTIACVSGGIGSSEREELQKDASKYSLWIKTVASKSGAYLADIKVAVQDLNTHETVLSTTLDGPWLFLALPAGRYEVSASYHDSGKKTEQIFKKMTGIKNGEHRQMLIYFDASNVGELNYKTATP